MASRVTVEDLRSLLSSRGLPTHGRKADLLERCRVHRAALLRAPGVTAEAKASLVPPTSFPEALIEPSPTAFGASGVSGGGFRGGREAFIVNAPSQYLFDICGTTKGPDACWPSSIPPGSGASQVGGVDAASAVAARLGGPRGTGCAPSLAKNERARLAHILYTQDVAAGVITSRGGMSRQQKDALKSRGAVWAVVFVASVFNGSYLFDVPVECSDGGIDPNAHPHHRTGATLKAM